MKLSTLFISRLVFSLAVLATILLIYLTHAPMEQLKEDYGGFIHTLGDKALHLLAYGGVAFLYFLAARFAEFSRKALHRLLGALLVFSAVDEGTQALVGRNADWLDLLFNLAGIVIGLFLSKLFYIIAKKTVRRFFME
ncbi:VanZ family protein [Sedimentisphaera cyanobacteriorum]|nr:VanZ family protein [Sedimentisphaera cyanobacteriorum]